MNLWPSPRAGWASCKENLRGIGAGAAKRATAVLIVLVQRAVGAAPLSPAASAATWDMRDGIVTRSANGRGW